MYLAKSVGAINIEYENIKFENGNIKKQSGDLNEKVGNFSVKCWDTRKWIWQNLTYPNLT